MALDPKLTKYSTASPTIQSFDFEDIATGLKFVSFYLAATNDSTNNVQYILVTNSNVYSNPKDTIRTTTGATYTFDSSPFNITRTVKGTAFVNIGRKSGGGGSDESHTVQIQKWDGSNATNITSQLTTICGTTPAITANQLPCTETIIAEGEQLRIVINLTVVGAGHTMAFGHDPRNRDGTYLIPSANDTITASVFHIPMKVE